jgi:hypothetical protein
MYFIKKYRRGIFNRYMKGRPVSEIFIKDMKYGFGAIRNFLRNGFKTKNLLVYPHYPSKRSVLYKMAGRMRYNLTNKPTRPFSGAIYWEYYTNRTEFALLEKLSASQKVINLYSRDISKTFVDTAFLKIFGYSANVDPLTFSGKMVRKNNLNAMHDGVIMDGPAKFAEQGFIYQVLIDNTVDEKTIKDIRVPIIGGVIDIAMLKYRRIFERFSNTTIKAEIVPVGQVLNEKEIELLNQFCDEIHLDYGELDVLRNNNDGKLYIVDVNNTPHGPPPCLSRRSRRKFLNHMAELLKDYIVQM